MTKTRRQGLDKCKARKTASGAPWACYATLKEKCEMMRLTGRRPAECRRTAVLTPRMRRVGPIRPVGNPIDACVVTAADLQAMTVQQIVNFIAKYKRPVEHVNPATGARKTKAEYIDDALKLAQSCPKTYDINPDVAPTRSIGLALKYRGVKVPVHGNPALCGAYKDKSKSVEWKMRPCREAFQDMYKNKATLQ